MDGLDKRGLASSFVVIIVLIGIGASVGYSVYDQDSDGLRNYEEWMEGTSFTTSDSDGDGLNDNVEVNKYGTNPLHADSDNDSLEDGVEVNEYGTNPSSPDTDGDNLDDATELKEYGTEPTSPDSDEDGLKDGPEVNVYGSDPLEPDTDNDSLDDGKEINEYETNPTSPDTDNDGLEDLTEVKGWAISVSFEDLYKGDSQKKVDSDPNLEDTDNDNLNDFKERKHGSNPRKKDTDEDSLDDSEEINEYNTNPIDWDTDNDRLNDYLETNLSRANSQARDVFVEVDWTETSQSLPATVKTKLVNVFEQAPIDNPDGSQGVNLHIDIDEEVPTNTDFLKPENVNGSLNDIYDFREKYFTSEREDTHYYAILTKFVETDEEMLGGVAVSGVFSVSTYVGFNDGEQFPNADKSIGTTFMHELGHVLGLDPRVFDGIDSENYAYTKYTSVMNYNSINDKIRVGKTSGYHYYSYASETYQYSSDGVFDDWNYLAKGFKKP